MASRVVILFGLALVSKPVLAQQATGEERLLGAEVNTSGIVFRVASHGCTNKSSFGVETLQRRPLVVRLIRLRPDYCEGHLPDGTLVRFSFAEIGATMPMPEEALRQISVVNAPAADPLLQPAFHHRGH